MKKMQSRILSITLTLVLIVTTAITPNAAYIISEKYKKIDNQLIDKLTYSNDYIPIKIWLTNTDISSAETSALKKFGLTQETLLSKNNIEKINTNKSKIVNSVIAEKRKNIASLYSKYNSDCISLLPDSVKITSISQYAPVINAVATKSDILKMKNLDVVDTIYYGDDSNIEPELDVSRVVVKANSVQSNTYGGYTGNGIKVGIMDGGIPDNNKVGLPANRFIVDSNCGQVISDHATNVATIIAGNKSPKGIAPDVSLYCTYGRAFQSELDWMVASNVHIVNMSAGFSDSINTYSFSDRYVDYISYTCNLVFVKSAGNNGLNGITSPGMAYNAITVGNVDDKNTFSVTDDELCISSSYKNIQSIATVSKPDICAPGTNITITSTGSGTSYAAPHVTGALALMAQQDSTLQYVPTAMKAIITAGVNKSVHHYVPSQRTVSTNNSSPAASYIQYGAGILDCLNNRNIINDLDYDYGYYSSNVASSTYTMTFLKGKVSRISVVGFNQKTNYNDTTASMADFDIEVCDSSGNIVAQGSTTNNVEIVEFIPNKTETYTVYVDRTGLMNTNAYFAIAWC